MSNEDSLERFRLENSNLRRQLKETKADSVLQLNKASAFWDEIQELKNEIKDLKETTEVLRDIVKAG